MFKIIDISETRKDVGFDEVEKALTGLVIFEEVEAIDFFGKDDFVKEEVAEFFSQGFPREVFCCAF